MSTVIICLILMIICIYAIQSYTKKLSQGCCGGEAESVKKIQPHDKNKKHYTYCKRMNIEGMTCQNCKKRIENAFCENHNYYMDIHFHKKIGYLYSKIPISDEEIQKTIYSLGYQVSTIEDIYI